MNDQATRLRGLMETRTTPNDPPAVAFADQGTAKIVAVTSGKGGVGKSTVALNLAVALRRLDQRVCLIDANSGLANIDLLCGLNGYWNLMHVASGARRLSDVLMEGPLGVQVLSGAGDVVGQSTATSELRTLETDFDFLVIDTGSGLHAVARSLVTAADIGLVLTTPEPTAIADAYATVKSFQGSAPRRTLAVVNQASNAGQANNILDRLRQTSRTFINADIINGGSIPLDSAMPKSVLQRVPLLLSDSRCPAAEAIARLAQRVRAVADSLSSQGGYFQRINAKSLPAAA